MAFTSGFLRPDSLRSHPSGFEIVVGLPWMRALPWSSIQSFSLAIDDEVIDGEQLLFELDGALVEQPELAARWDEYWAMHHPLRIRVSREHPLRVGSEVSVSATAGLRIPYLSVGPGTPMVVESSASRVLTVLAA